MDVIFRQRGMGQWLGSALVFSVAKFFLAFSISLKFSLLPHELFRDRSNYLFRLDNSEALFFEGFGDQALIIFNEPLFSSLNYVLSGILTSDTLLSFYVFINTFFVLIFVLFYRKEMSYSLIAVAALLVIPYFYGATLGAIRQGLGLNLVLIGLMRRDGIKSNSLLFYFFMASLFHVVFYVFFAFVFSYRLFDKFFRRQGLVVFFVFLVVLLVSGAWRYFANYLSGSQSYDNFESSTSGATFFGWLLIFLAFVVNFYYLKRRSAAIFEAIHLVSMFMFMCFLVFYWVAPGPYRILYSCIPILICAIIDNFNKFSAICYIFLFLFSVFLLSVGSGAGSMNVSFIYFLKVLIFGAT